MNINFFFRPALLDRLFTVIRKLTESDAGSVRSKDCRKAGSNPRDKQWIPMTISINNKRRASIHYKIQFIAVEG